MSAGTPVGATAAAGPSLAPQPPGGRQRSRAQPGPRPRLSVARLEDDGSLGDPLEIAGGPTDSVVQPTWSPDGRLAFVSDLTGWWNLYRWREHPVEPLCPMAAEFGEPQWVFGGSLYGFQSADRIVCCYFQNGHSQLALLDTATWVVNPIDLPYSAISQLRVEDGRLVFIGASSTEPASIVLLDLASRSWRVLYRSRKSQVDAGYLSAPRAIEFPTENGLTAHGYFYPPRNCDYAAPTDERPPLLVLSHGGPTSAASASLKYGIQYWTSRGIAVLGVAV